MSATKKFLAAAALLAAGATGQALFTASTPQAAREEIAAAHDVTTRHGELAVRVDAGGADVTALAPIDPGTPTQVLTVSDSGVPVWRDPSGGTVTASQISDSTTTGRALLTAATAAAARAVVWPYPIAMLAGGLDGEWSALGASPAGSSASITGGQVTITMAALSCDWTAPPCSTGAARAVRSIPYYTVSDWSLRARLVSATSSASFVPMFGITTHATTWSTAVAKYVMYFAGNSDTVTFMRVAGSGTAAGSASITSLRAGQGWLRLDHLGGRYVAYGGTGTGGEEPTSWTLIGGVASTGTDPPPQLVVIGATGSVAATVVWDSVRLQAVQ